MQTIYIYIIYLYAWRVGFTEASEADPPIDMWQALQASRTEKTNNSQ